MKNKLLTISKIGLLAFTILVSQACQEDYESFRVIFHKIPCSINVLIYSI